MDQNFDLRLLDDDVFSSPVQKPYSAFSPFDDSSRAPISMPGFDSPIRVMPAATLGMNRADAALTIFDVSKCTLEAISFPTPRIHTSGWKPNPTVPCIFKPFASVELTEMTVHQLRGVLRGNERKIAQMRCADLQG
jgi:hypothetical protein